MFRFIVQLQPTDEGVAEVVGPVEAAFAAGRSSRGAPAEKNHRRVGSTDFVAVLKWTTVSRKLLPDVDPAGELQSTVATWVVGSALPPQPFDRLGSHGFGRLTGGRSHEASKA